MNTLEMMNKINQNRHLKFRLPMWNKREHIKYNYEEVLVHSDNKTPFRYMRFLNYDNWEEYKLLVPFSSLKPGQAFARPSYAGIYIKVDGIHIADQPTENIYYYNRDTFYLHTDHEDFEVEVVE